jgi:hypothetical protein
MRMPLPEQQQQQCSHTGLNAAVVADQLLLGAAVQLTLHSSASLLQCYRNAQCAGSVEKGFAGGHCIGCHLVCKLLAQMALASSDVVSAVGCCLGAVAVMFCLMLQHSWCCPGLLMCAAAQC